jgi:hypothetical protein
MGGGSALPYDAEIEYLESDVGAYINIPEEYNTASFTRYKLHFQFTSNRTQQRMFWSNKRSVYEAGDSYISVAQNNDWVPTGLLYQSECIIDINTIDKKTYVYYPGGSLVRILSHSTVGDGYTYMNIFYANEGSPNKYYAKAKLWYFQAYIDTDLVLDLIPVRVGQTGYMYDKVSGQLFGNAGTGSFILGPDKT